MPEPERRYILQVIVTNLEDEPMTTKENFSRLANLVFTAVALAMGVAVAVTSVLGVMDTKGQVMLLGIGLFCLAITALDKE
jgi:hypothetical protein